MDERSDGFDLIYSYTRSQAISDGVLVDVSATAKEAGIRYPVAITAQLWASVIVPDEKSKQQGQDEQGRLWDLLCLLRVNARRSDGPIMLFDVLFTFDGKPPRKVKIKSICGPGDEAEPVITVMLPTED